MVPAICCLSDDEGISSGKELAVLAGEKTVVHLHRHCQGRAWNKEMARPFWQQPGTPDNGLIPNCGEYSPSAAMGFGPAAQPRRFPERLPL